MLGVHRADAHRPRNERKLQLMSDGGDVTFLTQGYRAGGRLGQGRIIARPTENHELRVGVHLAVD